MSSAEHMLRIGRRGTLAEVAMALADVQAATKRVGLAWSLAWHDVLARYRGSILGPFWITLSMGVMVLGIGLLYAQLFMLPVSEYMPFVALGIVFWGFISGIIIDGCDTFLGAAGMLRQTALPMFLFVWRSLFRNLINLAHHLVIIVAVLVGYDYWRVMDPALALGGLLLVLANVAWIGTVAGIASARFRDVPQIFASVMQFAVFMTPVFWKTERIPASHAILMFNPFAHMLAVVRNPLLGEPVPAHSFMVLIVMAVLGWTLTLWAFSITRRRIVHYL
jgi:ABC-type polysaccharide/polyol phosphate export permease